VRGVGSKKFRSGWQHTSSFHSQRQKIGFRGGGAACAPGPAAGCCACERETRKEKEIKIE